MKIKSTETNSPIWKDFYAHTELPLALEKANKIAHNLWWVWNSKAISLFRKIDLDLWRSTQGNPVQLIQELSSDRILEIINDEELLKEIDNVYDELKAYMSVSPNQALPSVAYFSMEYGLTNILKIYSGGLGVLAGDYLKEASDSNVDLCAVGFLYRYGYFDQRLNLEGQQIANLKAQNFAQLPIKQVFEQDGSPMILEVPFRDRTIHSLVWEVNVGRVSLYLMDTDINQNSSWDRSITHQLYGGDWENRMKQEYMLGIGGILLLNKLGIKKDIYHCNEGHAAFINIQRLVDYIQNDHLTFNEALEIVRASALYTVHTPVPAGHDYFDENLLGKYLGHFPEKLGISWNEFINMGRENPDSNEKFSMSVFALNTCQEANGVSELHGGVSQKMFAPIWKGFFPSELHVGYVTNGVHMPTWAANEWKRLYTQGLKPGLMEHQSAPEYWAPIHDIDDVAIWHIRMRLKQKLHQYIQDEFKDSWLKNQEDPAKVVPILDSINPNALLIGFARRFATYKRAHLLFTDLDRLAKIVNDEKHPVRFIFAGKAHPADGGGQGLIKYIFEISRRPEFLGKIIFLENYDMRLARRLVSGVDVWLNTPTRPQEASGTSGEKAEMNGVLNFSVLDGWWYEGYRKGAGWALTDKRTYDHQHYQDQLDAVTIYQILENEIIPLYFDRDEKGVPHRWVHYIKNSISQIAPHYTMKRMIEDYYNKFYHKLGQRSHKLRVNNFELAKQISRWKAHVAEYWNTMKVSSFTSEQVIIENNDKNTPNSTNKEIFNLIIDKGALDCELGAEMLLAQSVENNELDLKQIFSFETIKVEGAKVHLRLDYVPMRSGSFKIAFRIYPKNDLLPHRMDFAYMRWIELDK